MSDKTARVYQIAVCAVLGDKGPAEAAGPFLLPRSERMQVLAHHDKLAGLPNRIGLDGFFPNARKLIVEKNRQIAVLYLDLDGFKGINDNLGNHMGDLLLKEVANRLTGCIRSDAFAADEFVVASPLSREEALEVPTAIANRIISITNQVFEVEGYCMKGGLPCGLLLLERCR